MSTLLPYSSFPLDLLLLVHGTMIDSELFIQPAGAVR